MRIRRYAKETLGQLRKDSVLGTGHTLNELEREMDRREQVIREIEKKAENNFQRKKKYLEKASEATNQRKVRYAAKAKEAEMNKSFFSELFDNLMAQYLFLTKLVLEAKRRRIYEEPLDQFGFEIDIAGMDAQAVTSALQNSSMQQEDVQKTIEEIEMEFETADAANLSLDLEDIKEEADMLSESRLQDETFDVGESWNSAIDERIEEELDSLEDSEWSDPEKEATD